MTSHAGKRTKDRALAWERTITTASRILRFAGDVLLFASTKEQLQKHGVRLPGTALKRWDSRYIQET